MDPACIISSEKEASPKLEALAKALGIVPVWAETIEAEKALTSGSLIILPESLVMNSNFILKSITNEMNFCVLLEGEADWLQRYSPSLLEEFRQHLAQALCVFVEDPRTCAAIRLLTSTPVEWLGYPVFLDLNNYGWPLDNSAGNSNPKILLLPGREPAFEESETTARLLCESFTDLEIISPEYGLRGNLIIQQDIACVLNFDLRVRFGYEVAVAAQTAPVIGSRSLAAEAILFPGLAVDPRLELGLARDLLGKILYNPAQREFLVEQARARLAESFSIEAVKQRFEKGISGSGKTVNNG